MARQCAHRLLANNIAASLLGPCRPLGLCFTRSARQQRGAVQQRAMTATAGRTVRGVVFDMDGTLTVPCIDFVYMRSRVGVPKGMDILDYIARLSPEQQAAAFSAIEEIEEQALQDMKTMPGAVELARFLDAHGVPRGLITRNVRRGVQHFHEHRFPLPAFAPAITRECEHPYKPSPAALQHIAATWGVPASEVVMVGDSAKDDVVSGNRAGAITVLIDSLGRYLGAEDSSAAGAGSREASRGAGPAAATEGTTAAAAEELVGEAKPHYIVRTLTQLQQLLESANFQLQPPDAVAAAAAVAAKGGLPDAQALAAAAQAGADTSQ